MPYMFNLFNIPSKPWRFVINEIVHRETEDEEQDGNEQEEPI